MGVLLGKGDGTLQPVTIYGSGEQVTGYLAPLNGPFVSVAVADVNGDGIPDLVAGNGLATPGGWRKNFPAAIYLGNGDGTFQRAKTYTTGVYAVLSVAVADVNRDGKPDLVFCGGYAPGYRYGVGKVAVLLGSGDGTFQSSRIYNTGTGEIGAGSIAVADVNSDGRPDLLAANVSGSVGVLLNIRVLTRTVLTTSGSPSIVGMPVTFTATVKWTHGTVPDGESVMFFDGPTAIGTGTIADGVARFTTSSLTAKTHTMKAAYAGDSTFKPSTGFVKQVVDGYPTTTTLSSSSNPSEFGHAVTFTAKVVGTGPAPTGKVKFLDAGFAFGSATLNGSVATLTYSKLLVGAHTITAEYLGDAVSAKSTSPVLKQVVK